MEKSNYIKKKVTLNHTISILILSLLAISFLFPFIWLISSSLKEGQAIFKAEFSLIPRDVYGKVKVVFSNYKNAVQYLSLGVLFKNTLFVAVLNTILNLLFNSMAGYAFARLNFKGKEIIFRIILISMMIPGTVMLIPNLITVNRLGIYDTIWALVLPFTMSVYNIFLMRQHFSSFSKDLEEAAKIDGAGYFRIFFTIAIPLVRPMLVVLGITTFMWNYNNFLWPLVATQSPENATLALGLGSLVAAGSSNPEIYPVMLAGSVIVSLPLIIMFFFLQKYIIGGISVGAVKG